MTTEIRTIMGVQDDTEALFETLDLDDKIQIIVNTAIRKMQKEYPVSSNGRDYLMLRDNGPKYIKLTCAEELSGGEIQRGGVWCFINKKTQGVYKPASWRGPAKGERFNLDDFGSFCDAARRADWFGSWLYWRR